MKKYIEIAMSNIEDFVCETLPISRYNVTVYYIRTLVDVKSVDDLVIKPMLLTNNEPITSIEVIPKKKMEKLEEIKKELFLGGIIIQQDEQLISILIPNPITRSINESTTEAIMYGPRDSFVENIDINVTLIRRRLPTPDLKMKSTNIGNLTQTQVQVLYMENLTDYKFVELTMKKLSKINIQSIIVTTDVQNFLEDNINSIFPQFQQTDRPDTVVSALTTGKIVILVNNNPFVLIAPVTLFDFFQSPEDYVNKWIIGSLVRIVRFVSFFLSIFITPIYVAITVHHFQILPVQLLEVIIEQRKNLPFNPFWEALIILTILEIVREASIRMPTKASQPLGIVGGLIIGQAAVDAHLASNVLIIVASLSLLASSVVPNYLIGFTSRFLQLIMLIFAYFFGIVGLSIVSVGLLIHLNGLNSLRNSYLLPISPLHLKDFKDLIIRFPSSMIKNMPSYLKQQEKE